MNCSMYFIVQKKGTLWRKPRKRGGSPSGVNDPPIFATRKIKKTIVWTLCFLHEFDLIIGRIISMAAPVVPIHDARNVPIRITTVFTAGLPFRVPRIKMPPEMVNRDQRRIIKGI